MGDGHTTTALNQREGIIEARSGFDATATPCQIDENKSNTQSVLLETFGLTSTVLTPTVWRMAKAGAQHELVGLLINNFPDLAERLAEVAGVDLPGRRKWRKRMFSPLAKKNFESLPSVQAWREQIHAEGSDHGRTEATAHALLSFFTANGPAPSPDALKSINECTDAIVLEHWLMRAYQGESAAQIFQGTRSSTDTAPTANA